MANSLMIGAAGLELIGDAVNPEYRLATGMDGGAVTPDTVTLSSLVLDGDIISGERTGNKTWSFAVIVSGADRAALSANVDTLLAAVAGTGVKTFPVVWTPDSRPSTVFTGFRATATPVKKMMDQDSGYQRVELTFQTGPFGESAGTQSVSAIPSGGVPQIQVDGMNSGSFTGGTLDTSTKYEGAGACSIVLSRYAPARPGQSAYASPTVVGRSIASLDLSSSPGVSLRFRWPAPAAFTGVAGVTITQTLTSTGGHSTIKGRVLDIQRNDSTWYLVTFDLSSLSSQPPVVDLTAVTAWSVSINTGALTTALPATSTAWIDDLRALPAASVDNQTAEGMVLSLPAVAGSARAPVAVMAARWPSAQASGNMLTAVDSSFETGVGSWIAYPNAATLASTTAQADSGTHSLSATASTTTMRLLAPPVGSGTGIAVQPSTNYTLTGKSRAAATPRQFFFEVAWFDRFGNPLSVSDTPTLTDSTTAWTRATANVTSPPDAAFAEITVTWPTTANGEVHYVDVVGLFPGWNQTWVGGTGSYASVAAPTLTNALVHFPPGDQDPDATILAGLAGSPPTVTIPAAHFVYDDAFSVVLVFTGSAGAGVSRVITVTFTQMIGVTTLATSTLTVTLVGVQTLATAGLVTLPLQDITEENSNSSLTIAVSSANGSDTISDVALCSVRGQSVLATGFSGVTTFYVDKPDPAVGAGEPWISVTDRTNAVSAMQYLDAYVGPLQVEPGDNRALVVSSSGAPALIATITPRWLDEAQL